MPTLLEAIGSSAGRRSRDRRLPPGFALPLGFTATFVATVPLGLARGILPTAATTAGMAAVVAAVSWWSRPVAAVCTAALGWLMLNGFVVHRYGTLRWDGGHDAIGLAVLVLAAATAAVIRGLLLRRGHHRPARPVIPRPRYPERDAA